MFKLKNSDTIFSIENLRYVFKEDEKQYHGDVKYSLKLTWFDEKWLKENYGNFKNKRDEDYKQLLDILTTSQVKND